MKRLLGTKKSKQNHKDPKGSLTQSAYVAIRDKILRWEFAFGAPLARHLLAKEFGMSALPVAAALQLLENEGLVESLPRIGTRVRVPTSQQIRGHCVVREALESQAARLLAEKCSVEERLQLLKMAAEVDSLFSGSSDTDQNSGDQWFRAYVLHMRFHMRIAECTGCFELYRALEKNQVLTFNLLYNNSTKIHELRDPENWHQSLIEEITRGDPDAAEAAMRRHVRHGMEEIITRMQTSLPTQIGSYASAIGWLVE